mmetsp:Transcript_5857/g.6960  ORF Transcript_5857/g.6960 Transcript_5857/m.6960 type:complete len:130 (-) Transcript_5857:266-655(-)
MREVAIDGRVSIWIRKVTVINEELNRRRRRCEVLARPQVEADFRDGWQEVDMPSSILGKSVWQLESTKKLKIGAQIHQVPAEWRSVDVYMYHMFHDTFDLLDAQLRVSVEGLDGPIGTLELCAVDKQRQ